MRRTLPTVDLSQTGYGPIQLSESNIHLSECSQTLRTVYLLKACSVVSTRQLENDTVSSSRCKECPNSKTASRVMCGIVDDSQLVLALVLSLALDLASVELAPRPPEHETGSTTPVLFSEVHISLQYTEIV